MPTRRELLDADWMRLCEFSGAPLRPRRWTDNFSPRFASVYLVRAAHALNGTRLAPLAKVCSLVNFVVFGIEVPPRLAIGPGLVLPHTQGTVIGAGFIGSNVTIYQQVTLGAKLADFGYDVAKRPHVEDGVIITAGAKILGPVRLGAGCIVGANAVVLSDVPPKAVAVGVPARVTSAVTV
ncbi:MAG: serine acetyltransferase [Hyphomicrobium sp.]|nr:serine acetyltransferase [Hyphomicrobium sp.]